MKTNLYYKTVFQRTNVLKQTILGFFLLIASWPRLILEVFIRANMGRRYMSLATSITLFLLMLYYCHVLPHYNYYGGWSFSSVAEGIKENSGFFIFACAFFAMSIKRYLEIKLKQGSFDSSKFTLSSGDTLPFFYQLSFGGNKPTRRQISTIYEPLSCFIIGVILTTLQISFGPLIMVCSVIYSLSYFGAYYQGDQFVMDKMDEMICSEELLTSFVEGKNPEQTRGFEFMGDRTGSKAFRRTLVEDYFMQEPATSIF